MGNNQSVRATHFNRPEDEADPLDEESLDQHHINISNKMIERLVEDAALVGNIDTGSTNSKGDHNEKIFIEKLRNMDDAHSELSGLTPEELNALMARVEMRTASLAYSDPVCVDVKNKIIDCYDMSLHDDITKCWATIGEFSNCVQDASTSLLHARREQHARDSERRSRRVARARALGHPLRELPADAAK